MKSIIWGLLIAIGCAAFCGAIGAIVHEIKRYKHHKEYGDSLYEW